MMAAAARESHRSPSQGGILSPEREDVTEAADEDTETIGNSTVGGGGVGAAAREADVGNADALLGTRNGSRVSPRPEEGKSTASGIDAAGRGQPALKAGKHKPPQGSGANVSGGCPVEAPPPPPGTSEEVPCGAEGGHGQDLAKYASSKRQSTERTQRMYDGYRQTQDKLKMKREESATVGCTFTPQLSSRQKDRKLEESSAYHHLYKESVKQRQRRDQMVRDESVKLSFKPVLPTASSRLAARTLASAAAKGHKRAEHKSKATADEMYRNCTFAPDTVRTKAATEKILAARGEKVPLVDRLYTSSAEQSAVTRGREEARTAKELAACSFRPNMTASSTGAAKRWSDGSGRDDTGSVHERLFGIHGEKLSKKATKKQELVEKELTECTFSPSLVAKPSTARDRNGGGGGKRGPVHERLYGMRNTAENRALVVDPECTFRPNLSLTEGSATGPRGSKKAPGRQEQKTIGAARVEEMYSSGKQRQKARSQSPRNYAATFRDRDEEAEMALCTFQPNVSVTAGSRFKAERKGDKLFDSLYANREEVALSKERARLEAMKSCPFSPELHSQKTRIGRSLSPRRKGPIFEELYKDASTQQVARTLSADNLQAMQCPFRPELVARPQSPGSIRRRGPPTSPRGRVEDEDGADHQSSVAETVPPPPGQPQETNTSSGPGDNNGRAGAASSTTIHENTAGTHGGEDEASRGGTKVESAIALPPPPPTEQEQQETEGQEGPAEGEGVQGHAGTGSEEDASEAASGEGSNPGQETERQEEQEEETVDY